jgi:hypothetical protein
MSFKTSIRGFTALIGAVLALAAAGPAAQAQTVLTACTTISVAGNYVLGNSIEATGDCFILATDNVAIDFKGKKLTGNGTGSGIRDDGSARDYAIISNGKIRNFNDGINLPFSGYATIHKMDVSENSDDGINIGECCSTLEDVKANDNGNDGIRIGNCCSVLNKVKTKGNGDDGMDLRECCYAVNGSTSTDNDDSGIVGDGCCTSVNDSKSADNGDDGIFLTESDNIVNNSTASGNGDDGIELDSSYNLVNRCKVKNNAETGILMNEDDSNQITASTSKGNDVGVAIECPSTLLNVKATGNSSDNLVESGGTCTKLNVKAP